MESQASSERPPPRRRGVAPTLLLSQVANTASWALEDARTTASWRRYLLEAPSLETTWFLPEARVGYLEIMLASHFTTVATFVPTDVDAHIRHHVWQEIETASDLAAALAAVDEAASWDPRPVSARTVAFEGRPISGHDGEWLAVRAGALGRALALGLDDLAEGLIEAIDRELSREADALAAARARLRDDATEVLCLATISAHNCGDLSRVVEAWPASTPRRSELVARFARLGHEDPRRYGGEHHLAGHVNKEVMASENHRFLALRAPRCLRRSRALLLPIGPFFDRWGEEIGSARDLEDRDRGEVLAALVNGLDQAVDRWGYHRAIAGLHRTAPGGVDRLEGELPARLRKHVQKGPLREALRVDEARFVARMNNACKSAVASYRK